MGGKLLYFGWCVKGKRILGQYPEKLGASGSLNIGRGRIFANKELGISMECCFRVVWRSPKQNGLRLAKQGQFSGRSIILGRGSFQELRNPITKYNKFGVK